MKLCIVFLLFRLVVGSGIGDRVRAKQCVTGRARPGDQQLAKVRAKIRERELREQASAMAAHVGALDANDMPLPAHHALN